MATYTAGQDQDVATTSSGLGAGAGDHLPVGDYGSMDYRSAMRFVVPPWSTWTKITSATLKFYISDHQHVAPKNSSIFCSRMNVPVWSKAQGTQDCESGFSGSNTTQYGDIQSVSNDRITFGSGSVANASKTLDVTAFVQYYWQNNSPLVFVFDNNGSDQYTEIWSLGKSGTTYDAVLTITYETNTPPNAPTLGSPAANASLSDDTPTFTWTHSDPQGDPQASAQWQLYNSGGTAIGGPVTIAGATASYTPAALTRNTTYQWSVATADAAGVYGLHSAKRSFTIKPLPVVTIDPVRYMEYVPGSSQPRLRVKWSVASGTQYKWRVTASGYDSGLQTNSTQSHLLSTLNLSQGIGVSVTVYIETSDTAPVLTDTDTKTFTPRWGLTVHRRDLQPSGQAAPTAWGTPVIVSTVPTGASLVIEYGSSATATSTPTGGWLTTLSAVVKRRYLFWRAWFIPGATTGPTLDKITLPHSTVVEVVDKWHTTLGGTDGVNTAGGYEIDPSEFVYGTRSISSSPPGAGPYGMSSEPIHVRGDRSYILTGLMKSVGNSGAQFKLCDSAGNVLTNDAGTAIASITGHVSQTLVADADWFDPDSHDVNRYATPVWKAPSDMTVYVVLRSGGVAGSQCWWDGLKLEESTVATPWAPGAVGATSLDAGGVQIDGSAGAVLRYRGTTGGVRDTVEGGAKGLVFGSDLSLHSPQPGLLRADGLVAGPGAVLASAGLRGGAGGPGTSGLWCKLGHGFVSSQYQYATVAGFLSGEGMSTAQVLMSHVAFTIKQQAAFGSMPSVDVDSYGAYPPGNFMVVITSNAGPTAYEFWVKSTGTYETFNFIPYRINGDGIQSVVNSTFIPDYNQTFVAAPTTGILQVLGTTAGWQSFSAPLTRHLWLGADTAGLDNSTMVVTAASPNQSRQVQLNDAVTSGAYWLAAIPMDWTPLGAYGISVHYLPVATDAVAHTVRWEMSWRTMNAGAGALGAAATGAATSGAGARTADVVTVDAVWPTFSSSLNPGDRIRFQLRRLGADAADTYVGAVKLLGVTLIYTAIR